MKGTTPTASASRGRLTGSEADLAKGEGHLSFETEPADPADADFKGHIGGHDQRETFEESHDSSESVPVDPFKILLSSSCIIDDLVALDGESCEHARTDATLAICEAFHQALELINQAEGTTFSMYDFQIKSMPA